MILLLDVYKRQSKYIKTTHVFFVNICLLYTSVPCEANSGLINNTNGSYTAPDPENSDKVEITPRFKCQKTRVITN